MGMGPKQDVFRQQQRHQQRQQQQQQLKPRGHRKGLNGGEGEVERAPRTRRIAAVSSAGFKSASPVVSFRRRLCSLRNTTVVVVALTILSLSLSLLYC